MNMVVHPQQVLQAHWYACAAAKQNKFVQFKDAFWDKSYGDYVAQHDPAMLLPDHIETWLPSLNVDVEKLKKDAQSDECRERVQSDMAELKKFHVNGTPSFFINGTFVGGGIPKEDFERFIDEKLKEAASYKGPANAYYAREVFAKGEKTFKGSRRQH